MEGRGPGYSVRARSKADGRPYWETAYNQLRAHVTQYRTELEQLAATDEAGREQMLTKAPPGDALIEPLRFIRGKSHVGGSPTGDVFDSITAGDLAYMPPPGYPAGEIRRRDDRARRPVELLPAVLAGARPRRADGDRSPRRGARFRRERCPHPAAHHQRHRQRATSISKGDAASGLAGEGAVLRDRGGAGEGGRRIRIRARRRPLRDWRRRHLSYALEGAAAQPTPLTVRMVVRPEAIPCRNDRAGSCIRGPLPI